MINELDEMLIQQKQQGLDNPNAYKVKLVGCYDWQLELEQEYLEAQLYRCEPKDEKYFKAKQKIVDSIMVNRNLKPSNSGE